MTTGEKIRQARKNAGLTQKQLSSALGVTESFISQYESGKRKPKLATLGRIAKALGTNVHDMIGPDWSGIDLSDAWGEPNTDVKIAYSGLRPEDSAADGIDTQESDLVQSFRSLNNLGRDEAIFYVHHLADQEVFTKEDPAAE